MSSSVDFDRLAEKLAGHDYAYLITVDTESRPHPVPVMPVLRGDTVHIGALGGRRSRANLTRTADVTVMWPPPVPGGYTVIVDGIPASALTAGDERLPHISGDYKFDWRNSLPLDAPAFDDAEVKAQVAHELERFGAGNCVLLHCHTPTVIERALAVGFTRIEGFEITKYIESAAYRAAHGAKGRRAARAAA